MKKKKIANQLFCFENGNPSPSNQAKHKMNKEITTIDLQKVCKAVNDKLEEIEKPIHSCCQKSKVMGFNEFEVKIKELIAKEVAKMPPTLPNNNPSVKDFEKVFASFEMMPANLSIQKKSKTDSLKRSDSLSQLNSTVCCTQRTPSPPRCPNPIPKHLKTATHLMKEFLYFKELQANVQQRSMDQESGLTGYLEDLKDLQKFSTDLNHFLQNIERIEDALTTEEQNQIKNFETAFKQLSFMAENNQYISSSVETSEKFRYLIEVINDLHKEMSFF